MKNTLEFILLTQSPALFLAGITLLICFFARRKKHRITSTMQLILGIICLLGGIALYYLGMLNEHFTIHDFWHVRVPGWMGLGLTAALILFLLYRSIVAAIGKRRAEKAAVKAEADRQKELEDAKNAAYASGKADALAAEKVADTVVEAVAEVSETVAPEEAAPAVAPPAEPAAEEQAK